MIFRFLADLCVLFHFLWILFLVFGVIFVLKRSKFAWFHFGGLLFSLFINIWGLYCPLTYLENYLYSACAHSTTYSGSFIARYLEPIIYPELSEKTIRISEILFVSLNLVVYAVFAKRYIRDKAHSR
jgi:hypothetical protein